MFIVVYVYDVYKDSLHMSIFLQSYVSCPYGIGMVGFVMASYGGSTTVSALVTSRIAEYTGRHILFAIASIINMSIFVAMYVWTPDKDHLVYAFVIVICWGLSEGIWQTQSNGMCELVEILVLHFLLRLYMPSSKRLTNGIIQKRVCYLDVYTIYKSDLTNNMDHMRISGTETLVSDP